MPKEGQDVVGGIPNERLVGLVEYDDIACELVSVVTKKRTTCCVRKTGHSVYEVSYLPSTRGEHQLSIKVNSQLS